MISKRVLLILVGVGLFFSISFGVYLRFQFLSLVEHFEQETEFNPNQVFGAIRWITPGLELPKLESYLQSRKIPFDKIQLEGSPTIAWTLPTRDYPVQLEKLDESWIDLSGRKLRAAGSPIQRLEYFQEGEWKVAAAIPLPPEIIATLGPQILDTEISAPHVRSKARFEDIPSALWEAVMAAEDPRFIDHYGLDPRGILRALWVNLRSLRLKQGGSTITAQLVKNLLERRGRNVFKKFSELFLSITLEWRYSKEEILERYLNEVYLGQVGPFEVHGVSEGAKLFFRKNIEDLNLGECAMLAGLIRGPGYYSPYRYFERARERQKWVLSRMVLSGFLTPEETEMAWKQSLQLSAPPVTGNRAPFFTDRIRDSNILDGLPAEGLRIYTSLDLELQKVSQEALKSFLNEKSYEGAALSIDLRTGKILAYSGGKDFNISNFDRLRFTKRPIGSIFKPILYTAAINEVNFEELPWSDQLPVLDEPFVWPNTKPKWRPANYEKKSVGWTTLEKALSQSLNTIAAKIGFRLGLKPLKDFTLNFHSPEKEALVPSSTLGTEEWTPEDVAKAYWDFATFKKHAGNLVWILSITNATGAPLFEHKEFDVGEERAEKESIALVQKMLRQVWTEGTARSAKDLAYDGRGFGKTGTTSSYRDAWFVGWDWPVLHVVWTGRESITSDPKQRLTGATGALPIWIKLALSSRSLYPETEPVMPESFLKKIYVDRTSGAFSKPECPPSQTVEAWIRQSESYRNPKCDAPPVDVLLDALQPTDPAKQ